MSKNVFLFSGQGSQYVGMAKELYDSCEGARKIFEAASGALGYDLADIVFNAPESELNKTIYSQPAIMACSLCAFEAIKEKGIGFDGVAGHSLGEYAAMVAGGMLSVEDGFKLIKVRAEAMQECAEQNKGSMCAVLKLSADEVEKVCAETEGYVVAVNYNSPVQTVIAGDSEAVDRAIDTFSAKKARCMKLNVASAFHSKLMKPASEKLYAFAKGISFNPPTVDFYSNVLGKKLEDFSDMPTLLAKHIISPVRFTSELSEMELDGYDTFIELGPKTVLAGLVKKTLSDKRVFNVENTATLDAVCQNI